jgi:hypothetical protein
MGGKGWRMERREQEMGQSPTDGSFVWERTERPSEERESELRLSRGKASG